MKKLTAAIAALALYFSASAFGPNPSNGMESIFDASDSKAVKAEHVSRLISNDFNEKYKDATGVTWRENQGIYFGYFKQNNEDLAVAYTRKGEQVAFSRQVKIEDLPLQLSMNLKETYKDWTLPAEVTEIVMDGESTYYLTVENKHSYRQLKCYQNGDIEVLKRIKKKVLVGSVR